MTTLAELSHQLRLGQTSAEALARAALERASDPLGEGARTFTCIYHERAVEQARALDALRRAGTELSPLMGIPISIKDLFDVKGEVTRAGSVVLKDAPAAERNATVVARLLQAGLVIIGRTTMVEFAYSGLGLNPHYGTPRNPWDRATGRIPGGSSSGAAVSVSDQMSAAAIGTDTGGSVRIPAALCGLTGFKPTARRVSLDGAYPLSRSLDSIGPLANSVACCKALDAVLSGEMPLATPPRPVAGLRLLVPTNVVQDGLDGEVSRSFERALLRLSAAGATITVTRVKEIDQWLAAREQVSGIAASEAFALHRELIARHQPLYDQRVAQRILRAKDVSAADFIDWVLERRDWIEVMRQRLAEVDALVMPTVASIAPPIAPLETDDTLYGRTNVRVLRNTRMINYLDGCALSIPCHAAGEAPVGLMVAGGPMTDAKVLVVGAAIEACLASARG